MHRVSGSSCLPLSDICIPRNLYQVCQERLSKESKVAYFTPDIPYLGKLLQYSSSENTDKLPKVQLQCCQPTAMQISVNIKSRHFTLNCSKLDILFLFIYLRNSPALLKVAKGNKAISRTMFFASSLSPKMLAGCKSSLNRTPCKLRVNRT